MSRRVRVVKEITTRYERYLAIPDDIESGDPTEEWINDRLFEMDEHENALSPHGWVKIEGAGGPTVDHQAPDEVEEAP